MTPIKTRTIDALPFLLTLTLVLLPLCLYQFVPGTDLPQHLAIASILKDLIFTNMADNSGYLAMNYELSPSPVPYHVAYGLLLGAMHFVDPFLALRLVLGLAVICYFVAGKMVLDQMQAPKWTMLMILPVVYSGMFYWGLFPCYLGLGFFCLAFAMLLRWLEDKKHSQLVIALVLVWCALGSNALLTLTWAAVGVALFFSVQGRDRVLVTVMGLFSLLPFVLSVILSAGTENSGFQGSLHIIHWWPFNLGPYFMVLFPSPVFWAHLVLFLFIIGCTAHRLVKSYRNHRAAHAPAVATSSERFLFLTAMLILLTVLFFPEAFSVGGNAATFFQWRGQPLLLLIAIGYVFSGKWVPSRPFCVISLILVSVFVISQHADWRRHNNNVVNLHKVFHNLPSNAALRFIIPSKEVVPTTYGRLYHQHLVINALTLGKAAQYDRIWKNQQIPIRPRLSTNTLIGPAPEFYIGVRTATELTVDTTFATTFADFEEIASSGLYVLLKKSSID